MTYLNNDYSLNYSVEPHETSESEIDFLKMKLV